MDEQTSESLVADESFDLFAEEEVETYEPTSEEADDFIEEATEPQEPAEEPQQEVGQPTEDAFELGIVYNGQAMNLTKEQAIELAQKGMNYDKVQQKLAEAQNSREIQLINRLAQKNGVTAEALMESLEKQSMELELNERANRLMDESYMDIDTARRVAKAELEKEAMQKEQAEAQKRRDEFMRNIEAQNAENQRKRDTFNREINELVKAYPDFQQKYPTIEAMPQVMQDAIKNGTSIKSAYQQVVIEEQTQTINALKQNQKNALTSAGSATGLGTSGKDAFLGALFADD